MVHTLTYIWGAGVSNYNVRTEVLNDEGWMVFHLTTTGTGEVTLAGRYYDKSKDRLIRFDRFLDLSRTRVHL